MSKGLVDELRLPLEPENRCVGYVEIEKTTDNYEYNAYVDCLQGASTFASHYVSYGGKYIDDFDDVKETSDGGYIAVGRSNSEVITKYGTGNNGKYDGIIVKFKSDGTVEWSKNFGGTNNDYFISVAEASDGYVAVGQTTSNDGDLVGLYNGGQADAIIVKYNKQGEVTYKRSYGRNNGVAESFRDIIVDNGNYLIVGRAGTDGDDLESGIAYTADSGIVLKLDSNFNTIWRTFFIGSLTENFNKIIKTSDNGYVVVGSSESRDKDMDGIGYLTPTYQYEAIILKYNNLGQLQTKKSFRGTATEDFYDVVETTDGYVAIGYSESSDYDMTDISKTTNSLADAIIVKYDKGLSNVIWKKVFGGSNTEAFSSVVVTPDNNLIAVGYSKSEDMDMTGIAISKEGYSNAIAIKFNNSDGNIITKKVFGGSNTDSYNKIIKTSENEYVVAGKTLSNDYHLKKFNKGHSDGLLVIYDNNLNLIKNFQEPVVIIDKLETIISNYGTSISSKYNNVYTTNDPTKDLLSWCNAFEPYTVGNTSNYYHGQCLNPFNSDDIKLLVNKDVASGLKILTGEHEYKITVSPNNSYNWHKIITYGGSSTGNVEWSNLKLKFKDGYIGSINSSITSGYLEPMALVNSFVTTQRPAGLLPTVYDIINTNGKTGIGSYPVMYIHIKPRKSELVSVILTSSADSRAGDGLGIYELRNFDMSVTPTE